MNYLTILFLWREHNIFKSSYSNLRPLTCNFYKAENLLCLTAVEEVIFKYGFQVYQRPRWALYV